MEEEVWKELTTDSEIIGHFACGLGEHINIYTDRNAVYLHPKKASFLCKKIADIFKEEKVEVVIAPALGGIILSQWVAFHLGDNVLSVYAEKEDDEFVIKRGYDKYIAGRRVLIVEDVINTGESAQKVIDLVISMKGHVVGLGTIFNCEGLTSEEVGVPKLFSVVKMKPCSEKKEPEPFFVEGVVNLDSHKIKSFIKRV